MKIHNRIISVSFVMVLAICILAAPLSASAFGNNTGVSSRISDKYDHLSASDESRIYTAINEAEQSTSAIFLVAVYDRDKGIPSGKEILSSFGLNYKYDSVVLLVIKYDVSMDSIGENRVELNNHKYEMFTYGMPHKAISNREVNAILDDEDVYNNIKGGNFADGAIAFIRGSADAINSEESGSGDDWIIYVILGGFAAMGIIIAVAAKFAPKTIGQAANQIPSKNQSNYKGSKSYGSGRYGSVGRGGGFGGSTGGSRGGR